MLYPIRNTKELEKLNELVSLEKQVKFVRPEDELGRQNFHEDMKNVFEPVNDSIENTSKNLTKTITETSFEKNKALEKLKNNFQEKMNERGILASYLMFPLSKITKPENTTQFKFLKYQNSKRVNDLLLHNTIPIFLHDNLLTIRDTGKEFE